MTTRGYTLIGWLVWQLVSRIAKTQIERNRAKIGAAGVIGLVLIGGVVAAKAASGDD